MLFSTGCEHAIRALTYLAGSSTPGKVQQVKTIAKALGLSEPTVAKVMHELVRRNLVRSNKGRGGGFILHRDPADIKLIEILASIDGTQQIERCIVGHPECTDKDACSLQKRWIPLRNQVRSFLEKTSIKELAEPQRFNPVD